MDNKGNEYWYNESMNLAKRINKDINETLVNLCGIIHGNYDMEALLDDVSQLIPSFTELYQKNDIESISLDFVKLHNC